MYLFTDGPTTFFLGLCFSGAISTVNLLASQAFLGSSHPLFLSFTHSSWLCASCRDIYHCIIYGFLLFILLFFSEEEEEEKTTYFNHNHPCGYFQ